MALSFEDTKLKCTFYAATVRMRQPRHLRRISSLTSRERLDIYHRRLLNLQDTSTCRKAVVKVLLSYRCGEQQESNKTDERAKEWIILRIKALVDPLVGKLVAKPPMAGIGEKGALCTAPSRNMRRGGTGLSRLPGNEVCT